MVATGNVGLAFGLTVAAGLCTAVGAGVVFCAKLASSRFLAASLGFSAGVMLYVSFVEIYSNKSNAAFVEAGYSDVEAYRYSTLTFFAGFLVVFLLDQLVHLIIHWSSKKSAEDGCACDEQVDRMTSTTSRAVLLEQEDVSRSGVKRDDMMEAGAAPKSVIMSDQPEDAPEGPEVDSDEGDDEDADADDKKKRKKEERSSRQPPDVMELIRSDPHAVHLHRMGILTATAIFIHNFPEGLATFVATLSDTSVGVGVAIAIAIHNIPEGICVSLPIYYSTGSKWRAFWWGVASGLSEPLGALVGYFALSSDNSLAFALVFALVAGMMTYIAVAELIPMALRYDPTDAVTTKGVIAGMVVIAASLLLFTL